jgi:hypothetical protein
MTSKESIAMAISTYFGLSQRFMFDVEYLLASLHREQVRSICPQNASNNAYIHMA